MMLLLASMVVRDHEKVCGVMLVFTSNFECHPESVDIYTVSLADV